MWSVHRNYQEVSTNDVEKREDCCLKAKYENQKIMDHKRLKPSPLQEKEGLPSQSKDFLVTVETLKKDCEG